MNYLVEDIFEGNGVGLDMNEDIESLPVEKSDLKITISLKRKLESDNPKRQKVKNTNFSRISCKDFLDFLDSFCKVINKHGKEYDVIERWYNNRNKFRLESCEVLYKMFLVIEDINNFVFIEKVSDDYYKILNHEILKRVIKIVFNKNKIETWINSYNSIGVNIVKEDDRLLFK